MATVPFCIQVWLFRWHPDPWLGGQSELTCRHAHDFSIKQACRGIQAPAETHLESCRYEYQAIPHIASTTPASLRKGLHMVQVRSDACTCPGRS